MKYTVTSPVEHNGKRYEVNASIDLGDEHAAPLLAIGHIVKPKKKAAPAPEPATEPAVESRPEGAE
jgi:hypothetical protein